MLPQFFDRHGWFNIILEIFLGKDKHDWLFLFDFIDLGNPLSYVVQGIAVVGRYADHEAISRSVLNFAIDAKVIVTRRVMNLHIDRFAANILLTHVDI